MALRNSWIAKDSETNALAVATQAAHPKGRHIINYVHASYSDGTVAGLLQVKHAASVVDEWYVQGSAFHAIEYGPETPNTAVSVELAAGGAGVVGKVTMYGVTE